jgi:hypothetical protein
LYSLSSFSYPPYTNFARAKCLTIIGTEGVFYTIIREIIIKSDGDAEVLRELSTTIFSSSGTISRTPGCPAPVHVRRIEYLKKLRDLSDNVKVRRFADRQIETTEAEIRRDLERDEEFGYV